MHMLVVADGGLGPEPTLALRFAALRRFAIEETAAVHRAHLDRSRTHNPFAGFLRHLGHHSGLSLRLRRQVVRTRHLQHRCLMLEPLFGDLERRRQIEDLLAVLDGDHPPRCEGSAVAGTIHLKDDRHARVAGADKVAMQGMAEPVFDGLIGCEQGLSDHLAAKDSARTIIAADSSEQVHFQAFKGQGFGQVFRRFHGWLGYCCGAKSFD